MSASFLTRIDHGLSTRIPLEARIERWQSETCPDKQQSRGIIARICTNCFESFQLIISHTDVSLMTYDDRSALRQCQALLRLWADGHGAEDGNLDTLLESSREVRQATYIVLFPLWKALINVTKRYVAAPSTLSYIKERVREADELYHQTEYLVANDTESANESDVDSETDDPEDNIKEGGVRKMCQSIKAYINCLISLGTVLEFPAPDHDIVNSERGAADYFTDMIRAKIPQADSNILQRLGKSSWDRFRRLREERESVHPEEPAVIGRNKSLAATSVFHDSGIGSSLPSPSNYAQTIVSTLSFRSSIAGGGKFEIPPLTAEAKSGSPFDCIACGKIVIVRNDRDWRNHLYNDVRPYICIFEDCNAGDTPFRNRQLWETHLDQFHRTQLESKDHSCPLCFSTADSGQRLRSAHIARHLEEIGLIALPRDLDSDDESSSANSSNFEDVLSSNELPIPDKPLSLDIVNDEVIDGGALRRERGSGSSDFDDAARNSNDLHIQHPFNTFSTESFHSQPDISAGDGSQTEPKIGAASSFIIAPNEVPIPIDPQTPKRKNKVQTLRQADWEPQKPRITQLYLEEDRTLHQVKQIMEEEQGFKATLWQYQSRIQQWQIRKIAKKHDLEPSEIEQQGEKSHYTIPRSPVQAEKPGDVMNICHDCKKEFKRPCDLNKHEKIHSRPWKCTEQTCKHYKIGWPTEKDRDRHINSKHSGAPTLYRCLYPPCNYSSKRESNCKQHMEKAHGWEYVRSKSNGRNKVTTNDSSNPVTPLTPFMETPQSVTLTTPITEFACSPQISVAGAFGPYVFGTPALRVQNLETGVDKHSPPSGQQFQSQHVEIGSPVSHSAGKALSTMTDELWEKGFIQEEKDIPGNSSHTPQHDWSQAKSPFPNQQQRLAAAANLLRTNPGIIHNTDPILFPLKVLTARTRQDLPPEVKTWSQLKQWAAQNPNNMPGVPVEKLLMLQALHFQDIMSKNHGIQNPWNM